MAYPESIEQTTASQMGSSRETGLGSLARSDPFYAEDPGAGDIRIDPWFVTEQDELAAKPELAPEDFSERRQTAVRRGFYAKTYQRAKDEEAAASVDVAAYWQDRMALAGMDARVPVGDVDANIPGSMTSLSEPAQSLAQIATSAQEMQPTIEEGAETPVEAPTAPVESTLAPQEGLDTAEAQGAEKRAPGPLMAADKDDPVGAVAHGLWYGVLRAAEETIETGAQAIEDLAAGIQQRPREDKEITFLTDLTGTEPPSTATGELVGGLSQFGVAMLGANKAGAAMGIGRQAGKFVGWIGSKLGLSAPTSAVGKAAVKTGQMASQGVVSGGVADYAAFDAADPLLSEVLAEVPALEGILDDWERSPNPDDDIWERKAFRAIEGAAIGGVASIGLGAVVGGFRLLVKARRAGRVGEVTDHPAKGAVQEAERTAAAEGVVMEDAKLVAGGRTAGDRARRARATVDTPPARGADEQTPAPVAGEAQPEEAVTSRPLRADEMADRLSRASDERLKELAQNPAFNPVGLKSIYDGTGLAAATRGGQNNRVIMSERRAFARHRELQADPSNPVRQDAARNANLAYQAELAQSWRKAKEAGWKPEQVEATDEWMAAQRAAYRDEGLVAPDLDPNVVPEEAVTVRARPVEEVRAEEPEDFGQAQDDVALSAARPATMDTITFAPAVRGVMGEGRLAKPLDVHFGAVNHVEDMEEILATVVRERPLDDGAALTRQFNEADDAGKAELKFRMKQDAEAQDAARTALRSVLLNTGYNDGLRAGVDPRIALHTIEAAMGSMQRIARTAASDAASLAQRAEALRQWEKANAVVHWLRGGDDAARKTLARVTGC